ncbi:MAG: ABC transporter ATP-binding protein [Lachnospirales bacterium]
MSILNIKNLKVAFDMKKTSFKAIRDVSFSIEESEILGIVGESGSGKSVTMKSVMGILPPNGKVTNGSILFDGTNLLDMELKEKRKLLGNDISMVFQDPMTALNPLKTIGFHLTEIVIRHQKVTKKEALDMALEALTTVEIPNPKQRLNQYPHELSGGMRQRVIIAMALINMPKLLIADEPTTALDVTIQFQILALIKKLQGNNNMSVVLITHDLSVVYNICHRIIVMYGGKIMETGLRDEIFNNPKHPYTKALLNSIPDVNSDVNKKLTPIEGIAPSLDNMPEGCPFAPRCSNCIPKCIEMPKMQSFSDTHKVYCHISGGDFDD